MYPSGLHFGSQIGSKYPHFVYLNSDMKTRKPYTDTSVRPSALHQFPQNWAKFTNMGFLMLVCMLINVCLLICICIYIYLYVYTQTITACKYNAILQKSTNLLNYIFLH